MMSNQRILQKNVETGELLTLNNIKKLDTPVLLASVAACWNDIIKVEHHCLPPMESPTVVHQEHTLTLHLSDYPVTLELQVEGQPHLHKAIQPGDMYIYTKGATSRYRWRQENVEILGLTLNSDFVARAAQELVKADRIEFTNPQAFQDLQLKHISLALKAELEAGCPGGRLYGESMATGLVIQMLKKYAVCPPILREYKYGLPQYKLNQALDYIHAHLDSEVKLADLAKVLGMSQYYFCTLFKQSMGVAPYRYVLQQRVERAKVLLKNRELAIADIALECGFANQSHFTKHFRQLALITPKAYRDNKLNS